MRLSGGECAIVLGGGGVKVIGWRAHQWEAVWPNCPLDWDATCDDITVFWLLLTIYYLLPSTYVYYFLFYIVYTSSTGSFFTSFNPAGRHFFASHAWSLL